MGKKLQGAKLRAVKRAKVALDELQEQQAEHATIATHADADLFVVDRSGTASIPHHLRPSKKASATTTKDSIRGGLSDLDQRKVDALLQVHGSEKIKRWPTRDVSALDGAPPKRHCIVRRRQRIGHAPILICGMMVPTIRNLLQRASSVRRIRPIPTK
jgi:hypothetical protein